MYHRTLSGLAASTDTTARMSPDPATWGQDSSLKLIRPCASGASRRPASSAQFTSGNGGAWGPVGPAMSAGHTVTITSSEANVEVRLGGEVLAVTDESLRLDETGLPAR